jgi:glutamyl-tRNA reductase
VALVVEGINHRRAPLSARECVYLAGDGLQEALRAVSERPAVSGAAILSTCNRVEFYLSAEDAPAARDDVLGVMRRLGGDEVWREYSYALEGPAALGHIFKVPAGLDSVVLGEGQILGQFKLALSEAQRAASIDSGLDFVMRRAINVAKRVRSETSIGRNAVGFGQAAVTLARGIFGDLTGKSALLIGAGKMAGTTARVMAGAGVNQMYISSRTALHADELAQQLARQVGAASVAHADLEAVAERVDVIICSSSSPDQLLGKGMVERIMAARQNRPLFLLDLAVPRDIASEAEQIEGVHLSNIDDLNRVVESGLQQRVDVLPQAETIIAEEVDRTQADLHRKRADPAIAALVEALEERRQRLLRYLPEHLSAEQVAEIDRITKAASQQLMHDPIVYLREHPDDPAAQQQVREIFGLTQDQAHS